MTRLIPSILVLVFMGRICFSQNLLWEKRFSWPNFDLLSDVAAIDSGNYMAVGLSYRYGTNDLGGRIDGLALIKFDEHGDTSFVRHLGGYYTYDPPYICKGDSGEVFVLVKLGFTSSNLQVIKIDYEGNILDEFSIRDNGSVGYSKMVYTKKRELLIIGRDFGITRDSMRIIKVNRIGIVLINKDYSGGGSISTGNYIEETPRGTYLASGTTSSNLWAVEIDSNGNQVQSGLLYRNSGNIVFEGPSVKTAPNNRLIASGSFSGSPTKFYLGSHDRLSGTKIWGHEREGRIIAPHVNDDGTIVAYMSLGARKVFQKIDVDSTIIWERPMASVLGSEFVSFEAISYLNDSSAVCVGSIYFSGNAREDFYIARISGVGVPYDPTTPVATKPQLGSKGGISIWPQPASHANGGTLHFGGFAGPATLALYNMKGQQVLPVSGATGTTAPTLLPRQPVAIGHLPPGLYVYRLVARDRVWMGKVVISE